MKALDQQNYTTTFLVDQAPTDVFNAINNVRAWWSKNIEGVTDSLNGEFIHVVKDIHYAKIKVIELVPNKKVAWLILENHFTFVKDQSEWVGTHVHFDISQQGDKTQLDFTHEGLTPEYECYGVCAKAWTGYIQNSLLPLITTGKGYPNQEDA